MFEVGLSDLSCCIQSNIYMVLAHTGSILNQDSEVHTGGKAANFHLYLYEVHTKNPMDCLFPCTYFTPVI